jgi:hypothetical protein
VRKLPWIEIAGAAPALALVAAAPDLPRTLATLDPLIVFRLLMVLWVLSHIFFAVQHLYEDLLDVRDYVRGGPLGHRRPDLPRVAPARGGAVGAVRVAEPPARRRNPRRQCGGSEFEV